ncbi:hypothetical protein VNO80_03582 [Phaseolus coccineus]|uniref:Pterin-binding domain-containing protein n=1 Tax=Phaseolus coccineus TaxID=3886 RepID=A0AAN9NTF6_PHACN
MLMGPSRKRFLGEICPRPAAERDPATIAYVIAGILGGANIVRVHNVKDNLDAVKAASVHIVKWENELNLKLESADSARQVLYNSDHRIDELELQLQKCIIEKNDLEIKMEEAKHDTFIFGDLIVFLCSTI